MKFSIIILLFTLIAVNSVHCGRKRLFSSKHSSIKSTKNIKQCGYEGCPIPKPGMINVHIVPHTHDDVGWLKTVDQYYYGSKTRIQKAGVQYILDSVVQELLTDPEKRFIYAESAFFFKWWDQQTDKLKEQVKQLVNEGRLEFISGSWSMNDEATVHYQSVIDQFTWGLRQLNDTFGPCGRPTIGWQIDPFGHSREMASLFAQMGYDGEFYGRIDYQDKNQRMATKTMEFIWQASANLGDSSDIFSGLLYNQYQAPSGFCFDILCTDEPIIDNKASPDYNVDHRVDEIIEYIRNQSNSYKTNNIMFTMGEDFNYQVANTWYKNLDKLILYTNERQQSGSKINMFYSTPACYLKALHNTNETWSTKTDDFFPYSSDPHAFWTGYYTSRPTIKRFERIANQFLQISKQLSATSTQSNPDLEQNLSYLREAMGIMQHHDAITGTEKQHVSDDYARILAEAIEGCEQNTKILLNQLTLNQQSSQSEPFEFKSCHNLNISQCDVSENSESFMVTVYNPLSYSDFNYVRIPISQSSNYSIKDYRNVEIDYSIVPIADWVRNLHYRNSTASYELVFLAEELPPMGFKSYFITRLHNNDPEIIFMQNDDQAVYLNGITKLTNFTIGNKYVQISFDDRGHLEFITADNVTKTIQQNFYYYKGALGNNEIFVNRSSGAYIFRPNSTIIPVSDKIAVRLFEYDNLQEVHQIFNEWVSQVIRIYAEENYVEFEWQIGGIPVHDNIGKEIIIKFDTNIESNGIFETDSNGRESIKRVRNQRNTWNLELLEPIAGNYYPITTKIALEDDKARLAILTDRAQGGSSIEDGSLEIMLHRRLLHDDAFGVNEALNETAYGQGLIARGQLYLVFGSKNRPSPSLKAQERFLQQRKLFSSWLFFSDVSNINYNFWQQTYNNIYSALTLSLPKNVNLMTYEPWKDNTILVRFEHLLEQTDDPDNYSKDITFNVQDVLHNLNIADVRETTLAANQWINEAKRFKFKANDTAIFQKNTIVSMVDSDETRSDDIYTIKLRPMQIRTFVLYLD